MSLIPYKRNAEVERKVLEELLNDTPSNPPTNGFNLEELNDCYRISGVSCSNGVYRVDFAKTLLDDRALRTQEEWCGYTLAARKTNSFGVASAPLHHALFTTLHAHKDVLKHKDVVEKMRVFLADTFKKFYVSTLSRVMYEPIGQDKVVHNFGLQNEITINADIVGPDEWLNNAQHSKPACKAILETDDLKGINDVYQWVTGKNTRLYRVNTKPNVRDERVVVLGVVSGWFNLGADGGISGNWPAFGVREQKIVP